MSIASWKVRAGLPVALVLVLACAPAQAQVSGGMTDGMSATVPNAKPAISSITTVQVPGQKFRIYGTVTDEAPAGLVVTLSGARAVNGLTAIVLANGTWSTVANIPTGNHGTITAKVTDWYGLTGSRSAAY